MTKLVLYGREDCCLCDDAREIVLQARERHEFELEECDIESDDALLRSYLERIPVVTIDGAEAFELFIDAKELDDLLCRVEAG